MSGIKALPRWLQGKYVAEDDFWKITNYFVENSRRKKAYANAGIQISDDAIKREAADIVRNTVPNYAYVGDIVRTARILLMNRILFVENIAIKNIGCE